MSKEINIIKGIGMGLLTAFLASVALSGLGALLILNETVDVSAMNYLSAIINGLSVLLGVIVAHITVKQKCIVLAGLTVVGYSLIQVMITVLFFESSFASVWTSLIAAVVAVTIGCAICLSSADRGGKRKHGYRHVAQRRMAGK